MGRGSNSNRSRHQGKYSWTFYPRKTPIDKEMLAIGKECERKVSDILVGYGFDTVIDISERTYEAEEGTVWSQFDLLVSCPYFSIVADVKYRYRKSPVAIPLDRLKYQIDFPLESIGIDEEEVLDRIYIFATPGMQISFISLRDALEQFAPPEDEGDVIVERHLLTPLPVLRKLLEFYVAGEKGSGSLTDRIKGMAAYMKIRRDRREETERNSPSTYRRLRQMELDKARSWRNDK